MRLLDNRPISSVLMSTYQVQIFSPNFALITNHLFLVYHMPSILLIIGDTIVSHEMR